MLYYREKVFWKKLAVSVVKNLIPIGSALCLIVLYSSADGASAIGETQKVIPSVSIEYSKPIGPEPATEHTDTFSFNNPTVGVLTSTFGSRWGRMHKGIDIGADNGTDIVAAEAGTVTCARWVSGYGNYVVIEHINGYSTAYGHCHSLCVSEGENVQKGQVIAFVGSTGNSTGPHLHFEVMIDGEHQNPLDYVLY